MKGAEIQRIALAGQDDAVDVRLGVCGQRRGHGGQGILPSLHLQNLVFPAREGTECQLAALFGENAQIYALFTQLVEAAAHGTAGPGVQGTARLAGAAGGVNVAQGEIVQAGRRNLGPSDGVIGSGGVFRVAVKHHHIEQPFIPDVETLQQSGRTGRGEGSTPDLRPQLLDDHRLRRLAGEDMDVIRPSPAVGAARCIEVVVARRNEDSGLAGTEGTRQDIHGILPGCLGIEQVAGEQQEIAALGIAEICQLIEKLALLAPALGRLFR